MLESEGQPILSEAHFYWGNCFICKLTSSKEKNMKRCTRCKSVYYCSQDHQKLHWKKHKKLCNYLAAAGEEVEQFSFFSGMQSSDREEWKTFRMNAILTCEIMLGRPLALAEKEIFLFPRACRVCHAAQDKMSDCAGCYCVTYCSEQHLQEDRERHSLGCRQLRIAMLADVFESVVNIGVPSIPSQVDKVYLGTAPSISHFLPLQEQESREISKEELDGCFLASQISGALTILDSIHKHRPELLTKQMLHIHVPGATTYEMMGLIKWEYLLHRLPEVQELHYSFIGPGVQEEGEDPDQPSVPPCPACQSSGKSVTYSLHPLRYSEFKKLDSAVQPDVVLVQNAGFSEFNDVPGCPGWEEGWSDLAHLLSSEDSLLIFTAYTAGEAEKDLERFLKYSEAQVLVSEENPMRSLRPCRDWENDRDRDVFYSNQFVTVLTNKPA